MVIYYSLWGYKSPAVLYISIFYERYEKRFSLELDFFSALAILCSHLKLKKLIKLLFGRPYMLIRHPLDYISSIYIILLKPKHLKFWSVFGPVIRPFYFIT